MKGIKHLFTGSKGEDVAVDYLKNQGFWIIKRNYKKPWGEIDIIAKKGNRIHFIEVKTLSGGVTRENDYEPEEKVDKNKRKRLKRIIETYLLNSNNEDKDFQIDILAIYLDQKGDLAKTNFLKDIIL